MRLWIELKRRLLSMRWFLFRRNVLILHGLQFRSAPMLYCSWLITCFSTLGPVSNVTAIDALTSYLVHCTDRLYWRHRIGECILVGVPYTLITVVQLKNHRGFIQDRAWCCSSLLRQAKQLLLRLNEFSELLSVETRSSFGLFLHLVVPFLRAWFRGEFLLFDLLSFFNIFGL